MGLYRTFVVQRITDLAMRNRRLGFYRECVVRAAEGQVLEIGIGSGLNLERYPCAVRELLALEPDPNLIRMAKRRKGTSAEYTRPVSYLEASAEEIRSRALASIRWCPRGPCARSRTSAARWARCAECCGPTDTCFSWSTAWLRRGTCRSGSIASIRSGIG